MDELVDEGGWDVTEPEIEDFSENELAHEGAMDVVEPQEFEDPGVGDWDTGAEDMGGFDDMGGGFE